MIIIGDLAGITAFVLFFRLVYLIFKCRKTKDWKSFKKEGIIFLICFILASVFADTSSDKKDSANKSNKTEKTSKKSSKLSSTKFSKISSKTSSKNNNSASSSYISSEIINNKQTNNSTQTDDDNGMDHTAQQGKIIGNVKTHIYHTADEHNYKISPNNEIVFSNEQDAINAGYRKALR